MNKLVALFTTLFVLASGCAVSSPANVCPDEQGHTPEILNETLKVAHTQGVSGSPAQNFELEVLSFNQSTNVALFVNGQRQGLFTVAGASIGPRSYLPREWSREEIQACQGKVLGTVFVMSVGAVETNYQNSQPLARRLNPGDVVKLRVDVCNVEGCITGKEKSLVVTE